MSESITGSSSGSNQRFDQIIAVLIAVAALLAAIATFLQTQASARQAQLSRDAQRYAIQAMGGNASGETELSYQWEGAYQTWSELDDLARVANKSNDTLAAERYNTVRDQIANIGKMLQDPYFGSDTGYFPDVGKYQADTYLVRTTELSERFKDTSVQQNMWSDKASAHIVQLTLLAVTLALYGLSTTVSDRSRVLFVGAGSLIAVVAVIWLVATVLQPVPALPDDAIRAFATGAGLDQQSKYEEAIATYDDALQAAPAYANALYARGFAYLRLNQYDDAVKDLQAARAAGRDDTYVGWNLGWIYYLQGKFEDAIQIDQVVLARDPNQIGLRLNLALARLANGENAAAKDEFASAFDLAAQIVADAHAEGREPPASLWYYLDAGALDLQNLVDRLNNNIYDWTEAPAPETIQDPDSVRRIAQDVIRDLKSLTAALEYTGKPPGGEVTASITPFEFAREVKDDQGNFIQYDYADTFHYRTKKVQVTFDYEGMKVGQPVLYKVYLNGYEYTSLRLVEEWPESLGESGSAQKPLSYEYSRLFILPRGHYDVEMYADSHLVQRGSFTILAEDAPVTGQAGSVLFRDNFVDRSFADWVQFSDAESTRESADNAYHMALAEPSLTVWSNPGLNFIDVQIEVDATRAGGPDGGEYGLICRYQDVENFYVLKASNNGYASISKREAGEWVTLVDWQASSALLQGEEAVNHLRADCVGDRLALYVNDQLVVATQDSDLASGDVGLHLGTYEDPGTEMWYDDFVVSQPVAAGSVLYQEDFSDPASGWASYSDADYSTDYVDGGYRINVTLQNYSVWSHPGLTFGDAQIEVDAARIGGPETGELGVICRYQDGDNYYVLKITGDGYYSITKRKDGEWVTLVDWQTSDAILSGDATNRLRADCAGDRLTLVVNDQLLAETQDADFVSGDIGLLAGTFEEAGTDILFDNLVVRQPTAGAAPPVNGVPFQDDFSDPGSGWPSLQDVDTVTDYADDGYRIYVNLDNYAVWVTPGLNATDMRIGVSTTKVAGPDTGYFGIICRYQDKDNFYSAQITGDGFHAILKRQAGEWNFLGADTWQASDTIRQGEDTNAIRAECIGDTLALYVNDELLLEAQDADFTSGDVGLLAGTFDDVGLDVLFDDFAASAP